MRIEMDDESISQLVKENPEEARRLIRLALAHRRGSFASAAEMLGCSASHLQKLTRLLRMKKEVAEIIERYKDRFRLPAREGEIRQSRSAAFQRARLGSWIRTSAARREARLAARGIVVKEEKAPS